MRIFTAFPSSSFQIPQKEKPFSISSRKVNSRKRWQLVTLADECVDECRSLLFKAAETRGGGGDLIVAIGRPSDRRQLIGPGNASSTSIWRRLIRQLRDR